MVHYLYTIFNKNIKDWKSLNLDDPVWFITRTLIPNEPLSANHDNDTIINNSGILPNSCIQGTPYNIDAEYISAPNGHQRINTHGVSKVPLGGGLPVIAPTVILSPCFLTNLTLDAKSDFGSLCATLTIVTLSGSTNYLTNKRDNTKMNSIIRFYTTNKCYKLANDQIQNCDW